MPAGTVTQITENGVKYTVDFETGQKTGFLSPGSLVSVPANSAASLGWRGIWHDSLTLKTAAADFTELPFPILCPLALVPIGLLCWALNNYNGEAASKVCPMCWPSVWQGYL